MDSCELQLRLTSGFRSGYAVLNWMIHKLSYAQTQPLAYQDQPKNLYHQKCHASPVKSDRISVHMSDWEFN